MTLPIGLEKTIRAFFRGCEATGKEADKITITIRMVEKLTIDFESEKEQWPAAETQLMAVAGLSGRLAGRYAELDGKEVIEWSHARLGLQDGKEECRDSSGARAKHCWNAEFDKD